MGFNPFRALAPAGSVKRTEKTCEPVSNLSLPWFSTTDLPFLEESTTSDVESYGTSACCAHSENWSLTWIKCLIVAGRMRIRRTIGRINHFASTITSGSSCGCSNCLYRVIAYMRLELSLRLSLWIFLGYWQPVKEHPTLACFRLA